MAYYQNSTNSIVNYNFIIYFYNNYMTILVTLQNVTFSEEFETKEFSS